MPTRRIFLAALLTGCARAESAVRLRARPAKVAAGDLKPGVTPLHLRPERDALIYVPVSAPDPAPLVLYLHGATGNEQQGIRRLSALADEFGFLLLSPASQEGTWDAIRSDYGPDVRFIDRALSKAFGQRRVDPSRIAVCGFSDGASYALGLGISNGDLFGGVMAFSPGFIPPGGDASGTPRVFISHGTKDQILPIDTCSRRLVPRLQQAGYNVKFQEFDGPHAMPPEIAREAIEWFLSLDHRANVESSEAPGSPAARRSTEGCVQKPNARASKRDNNLLLLQHQLVDFVGRGNQRRDLNRQLFRIRR